MPRTPRQPDARRAPRDQPSAPPRLSRRGVAFVVLCAICVLGAAAYTASAALRAGSVPQAADAPAPPEVLATVVARPHLVYLYSPTGDAYRRVAVAPLDGLDGPRYLTPLQCQRVFAAADEGLCLGNNYVNGTASSYTAYGFNPQFQVTHTYDQLGMPTRVRLAPDGRYGATTVFVAGHSYADVGFSTQTLLLDTAEGRVLSDLEQFSITRDGAPFQAVDFNFWGVTFARDANHFYATLGTGGTTYLIEGDLGARQARVLVDNVECPSLSPDNTRLVFKKRTSADARRWQLTVLDLATLAQRPVETETRNIDDQVDWLDDDHILYGLQEEGSLATNIWDTSLDGSEQPRIVLRQALSPAVVR